MKSIKKYFMILALVVGIFFIVRPIFAEDTANSDSSAEVDEELDQKKKEIEELEQKLEEVQGQKQTIASTISYLNNKIAIAENRISQTQGQIRSLQRDISSLSLEIDKLDASLDAVSHLLLNRIKQTYIRSRIDTFQALFTADDLGDLLMRVKYLQLTQRNDREMMFKMETARLDFDNQKILKQDKQQELDAVKIELLSQQSELDRQQQEKQVLLEITRNDELKFQSELSTKKAELDAIQSIIAGLGDETKVGGVSTGDTIASVIPGPSTCSSGAHLHFEVAADGVHRNPAMYLRQRSVIWDNGPDSPFNFSGSWEWPLNDDIRITQGYGMTFYAATMRYYGGAPHTGIDMVNIGNMTVKAVDNGTLYRGSIACRGGKLRYVRVEHPNQISSYYLHVNY